MHTNHSTPLIWSIFCSHWPWMFTFDACVLHVLSIMQIFAHSFSIHVDQEVAKYSWRGVGGWDSPKRHNALWKRAIKQEHCMLLWESIYLSCYHKIQYSNSHPQRANIPVRMTARAINSARAPTTTRAMCHGSRGTKETNGEQEE